MMRISEGKLYKQTLVGRGKCFKATTPPDSDYEEFLLQIIEGLAEELEAERNWGGLRVL